MPVRGLLVAVVVFGILGRQVCIGRRSTRSAEEAKEASGGASKLVTIKDEDMQKIEIHRRDSAPVIVERDKSKQWQMRALRRLGASIRRPRPVLPPRTPDFSTIAWSMKNPQT